MSIGKIIRSLAKEQRRTEVATNYTANGRFIRTDIYNELKARRKCWKCGKKSGKTLQIHHKIPVRAGGANDRENLVAICKKCHQILDKLQEEEFPR